MKATFKSNDLIAPASMESGQLYGRLIGLGARVTEKGLATETPLGQHFRPVSLDLHVPGIGCMNQCRDLLLHGPHNTRWAVSDEIAAPTRKEIEVPIPLTVPDPRP